MTNPDELERAVERLTAVAAGAPEYGAYPGPPTHRRKAIRDDLRLILSANREMREALEVAREIFSDMIRNGVVFSGEGPSPFGSYYIAEGALEKLRGSEARSALTTQRGDGE